MCIHSLFKNGSTDCRLSPGSILGPDRACREETAGFRRNGRSKKKPPEDIASRGLLAETGCIVLKNHFISMHFLIWVKVSVSSR